MNVWLLLLRYFFCSVPSSSGILVMHILCLLMLCHSSWMFCFFIRFLFTFQSVKFFLTYFQVHWFFPWPVVWWVHQRHSLFLLLWFWLGAFTLDFFLEFPFLCLYDSFILECCLIFFIQLFNMLIIIILHSLSDNSNICVVSESGSDYYFVSSSCVFYYFLVCIAIVFWELDIYLVIELR